MAKFKMIHRGIGLWRDHRSSWNVYFPVAEAQLPPVGGQEPVPHMPTISFCARVSSGTEYEYFEVNLAGTKARFEGLRGASGTMLSDNGILLPISVTPSSPTNDPMTATNSHLVWGMLELPRCELGWHKGKLFFDISYRGKSHTKRSSAVSFVCDRVSGHPLELVVTYTATGTEVRYPIAAHDDSRDVDIELRVMSPRDRIDGGRPNTVIDYDYAANHMLAFGEAQALELHDLPEIVVSSSSTPTPIQIPCAPKMALKATDDHLCSGAYGCDPNQPGGCP